jgi:hypothetical protein
MQYLLKTAGGDIVGRSAHPIVADGACFRTADQVWFDPAPSSGAFVETAPDPVPVPAEVAARQAFRAIYLQLGKTEDDLLALAAMQSEPARTLMSIDIRKSNTFQRDNPTLAALAGALGLTSADIDALFVFAATL